MTLRALLLPSVALFLFATPAWSKDPEPGGSQTSGRPAPSSTDGAASAPTKQEASVVGAEGDTVATDYDSRRRAALVSYKVGDIEASLASLRELTKECEAEGAACTDTTRAELYVALAIVLAGGKDDIHGAARLFHAALTRDPAVTVPRELATSPVQEAMRLANESTSYKELTPAQEGGAENGEATEKSQNAPSDGASLGSDGARDDDYDSPQDRKFGLLLAHAIIGSGADDVSDAPSFGAAAILGARFVDSSAWTTAIRGRLAVVGVDQEAVGGLSLLMGGTWYGARRKTMGYFLGGLGLDSYGGEAGMSANAMGGVTLGGFLLGGGADIGASDYGTFMMMCLHLGWGVRL